jgi:D-3-phosphoglycerate dehydrogenase
VSFTTSEKGAEMTDRRTVLLPEPIEEEARQLIEAQGLTILQASDAKPQTVAPLMAQADAIVLRTGIKMSADLLAGADRLMTVSRTGAGFDNVDLAAATRKGVIVSSSLGSNTTTVAEHALSLILALSKRLSALDRELRKGNFRIRYAYLPGDLRGKTLGVIGFGRIGREIARACHVAFGMRVVAHDDLLPEDAKAGVRSWVEFMGIEEVCRRADVITLHVPLTAETRGFIDWRLLSVMKSEAIIINTSRGGVIDEADLAEALRSRSIAGAGLDVFDEEPPRPDNPLFGLDNVILTPHAAALTRECVIRMAVLGAQRVLDVFEGFVPDNVANPEVLALERWKHLRQRPPSQASSA